jgi:hypothetical protein
VGVGLSSQVVRPMKTSLQSAIVGAWRAARGEDDGAGKLAETAANDLRTFPVSWIDWPTDLRPRMDILYNPEPAMREINEADEGMRPLPVRETVGLRWNKNPYSMVNGDGMTEFEPTEFLLPYWIARYHGLIAPPRRA